MGGLDGGTDEVDRGGEEVVFVARCSKGLAEVVATASASNWTISWARMLRICYFTKTY